MGFTHAEVGGSRDERVNWRRKLFGEILFDEAEKANQHLESSPRRALLLNFAEITSSIKLRFNAKKKI